MTPDPIEQTNLIVEAVFGPTPYDGVRKLRHAAEYCADQVLIESTRNEEMATAFCGATLLLHDMADCLDAELVSGVN